MVDPSQHPALADRMREVSDHRPDRVRCELRPRGSGEPVVQYGPFVMNTACEIEPAILDYRAGRLGAIEHTEPPRGEHK